MKYKKCKVCGIDVIGTICKECENIFKKQLKEKLGITYDYSVGDVVYTNIRNKMTPVMYVGLDSHSLDYILNYKTENWVNLTENSLNMLVCDLQCIRSEDDKRVLERDYDKLFTNKEIGQKLVDEVEEKRCREKLIELRKRQIIELTTEKVNNRILTEAMSKEDYSDINLENLEELIYKQVIEDLDMQEKYRENLIKDIKNEVMSKSKKEIEDEVKEKYINDYKQKCKEKIDEEIENMKADAKEQLQKEAEQLQKEANLKTIELNQIANKKIQDAKLDMQRQKTEFQQTILQNYITSFFSINKFIIEQNGISNINYDVINNKVTISKNSVKDTINDLNVTSNNVK